MPALPRRSRRTDWRSSARSPDHIRMMGDKITAKDRHARGLGVPLVAGSEGALARSGRRRARSRRRVGYPVLIKAAAGGRRARHEGGASPPSELENAWSIARTEAKHRIRQRPGLSGEIPRSTTSYRIAGAWRTQYGDVVHFGERDCSLQRRHQKLLEEAGSPALDRRRRGTGWASIVDQPALKRTRLPQRGHVGVLVSGRAVLRSSR